MPKIVVSQNMYLVISGTKKKEGGKLREGGGETSDNNVQYYHLFKVRATLGPVTQVRATT